MKTPAVCVILELRLIHRLFTFFLSRIAIRMEEKENVGRMNYGRNKWTVDRSEKLAWALNRRRVFVTSLTNVYGKGGKYFSIGTNEREHRFLVSRLRLRTVLSEHNHKRSTAVFIKTDCKFIQVPDFLKILFILKKYCFSLQIFEE